VTGQCRNEDVIRSLQAGFADHLCKPVDGEELVAAVRQLFERPAD
jgi:DNA-binding response OmpR family regulator